MHETQPILHKTPDDSLRVISAGAWQAVEGSHFLPHKHTTWEIVYYRSGKIACPVGTERYESQPGMLLATPPETPHAEYAWTAYANYFIQIEAPDDHPWPRVCFDDAWRTLSTVCAAIVRECEGEEEDAPRMLQLLARQLDLLLKRAHRRHYLSEAEAVVSRAERLIDERFARPVTISEIAGEVGVSPSYLRGQFARLRGCSPKERLHAVRSQQALAMLCNSSRTLETIAGLCGYNSASHLSRHIRRYAGKSPGAIRVDAREEAARSRG